jgi:hypothetical protein
MDPVLPMRPLGELLSSELGGAAQQTHQGRRASGWTLKIVEFARRLNVLAQLGLLTPRSRHRERWCAVRSRRGLGRRRLLQRSGTSAVQMVSSPEIGPFACDPGHRLGSIWSAITDSFKGRFQVMHTQKQHWLDYDPVALAVLVIGMIGLLALTI